MRVSCFVHAVARAFSFGFHTTKGPVSVVPALLQLGQRTIDTKGGVDSDAAATPLARDAHIIPAHDLRFLSGGTLATGIRGLGPAAIPDVVGIGAQAEVLKMMWIRSEVAVKPVTAEPGQELCKPQLFPVWIVHWSATEGLNWTWSHLLAVCSK